MLPGNKTRNSKVLYVYGINGFLVFQREPDFLRDVAVWHCIHLKSTAKSCIGSRGRQTEHAMKSASKKLDNGSETSRFALEIACLV